MQMEKVRSKMCIKNIFLLLLACSAFQVRSSGFLGGSNQRYLVDQNNVRSAHSLLVNLSVPQVTTYVAERQFAQVIYIGGRDQTPVLRQLETASHFYGLSLRSFAVKGGRENRLLQQTLREPETLAVVVGAESLGDL